MRRGLRATLPFPALDCPCGWWVSVFRPLLSPPPLPARPCHYSELALLRSPRAWRTRLAVYAGLTGKLPSYPIMYTKPWGVLQSRGPDPSAVSGSGKTPHRMWPRTWVLENVLGRATFLTEGARGAGSRPSEWAGAVRGEVRLAKGSPRPGEPREGRSQAGEG